MALDSFVTSTISQRASLMLLRISTGFLLIWSGLNSVVNARPPFGLGRSVEISETLSTTLGIAAGGVQVFIGLFCVIGLFRSVVLPIQAFVHGFTAASVWWAIVDPYRWYVTGVDRIVFNSHVFYPTIITFAACILLITFRHQDAWCLDRLRRSRPLHT
ncbi:hypothetical protein [Tateyamaria sp. SN3-11]|uniref:hypothetical protein n=1 Tax=Tateyamaria sp. SN3-11 TaxID=3092147 RepID=UPI0039E81D36